MSRVSVKVDPRPTSRLSSTRYILPLSIIYVNKFRAIYVRVHARKNYLVSNKETGSSLLLTRSESAIKRGDLQAGNFGG